MDCLSLFSSAGLGELNFEKLGIRTIVANELIKIRSDVYQFFHPSTIMINGDITHDSTKEKIIDAIGNKKIDLIYATPPCQGVSLIGKNKSSESMQNDPRNYLVFDLFYFIKKLNPEFVFIENVPRFLKLYYPYNGTLLNIDEILKLEFGNEYIVDTNILNAADFGVPQNRDRAIIRMYKSKHRWVLPKKTKKTTVREAIGMLPSLESGEVSLLKNHYARNHSGDHIVWMKHTPTGKSAFENPIHFPKNKSGERLKGFSATYKRMEWDNPAPTITMRNDAISSQSNVHPGKLLNDGTYSDSRVLTLRELFILSSIDPDKDVPNGISDIQIRHMIGESVPPLMVEKILSGIKYEKN
jgi:DNA (cytosine-5)-methyltransferase 1